jgi:hypothetical protein
MQYLEKGLYPVKAPPHLLINWQGKISPALWLEVVEKHKTKGLREVAREYGVSYESVRRMLAAAPHFFL